MRRHYNLGALHEAEMNADPIEQFTAWFRDAVDAQIVEPNAMSLATAGSDGGPLVRTVLLKNYDARGFVFYTNLESRKARQGGDQAEVFRGRGADARFLGRVSRCAR